MGISAFIYILCLLNYQYWSAAFASIFSYPVNSNKYMKLIILTFRLLSPSVKININPYRFYICAKQMETMEEFIYVIVLSY